MLYYGSIMCTHLGALCLQYKYMLHHDHQEYLQGRGFLSLPCENRADECHHEVSVTFCDRVAGRT